MAAIARAVHHGPDRAVGADGNRRRRATGEVPDQREVEDVRQRTRRSFERTEEPDAGCDDDSPLRDDQHQVGQVENVRVADAEAELLQTKGGQEIRQ